MSVITRLIQITRAATGELLDKLEDPTMMMNHYVREAQAEIEKVQQEIHKQEAMARVLGQQADEAVKLAEISENKALEALTAGNELQARDLLNSKLFYTQKAQEYSHSLEQLNLQIPVLAKRLEEAKAELAVMQKKREDLAARVQQAAAKSHTAMPSFSQGFHEGGSASRGFQRMEEKILQWEAHLDLKKQPYSAYTDPSTTAAYPVHTEKDAILEQQLELLRKKLPTE